VLGEGTRGKCWLPRVLGWGTRGRGLLPWVLGEDTRGRFFPTVPSIRRPFAPSYAIFLFRVPLFPECCIWGRWPSPSALLPRVSCTYRHSGKPPFPECNTWGRLAFPGARFLALGEAYDTRGILFLPQWILVPRTFFCSWERHEKFCLRILQSTSTTVVSLVPLIP
jgi:hypothetical protein